ncbi:uncharacterized protein LOC126902774 isoform X2 [Daktulosphaira vitifoliae]|uniref:uncharacterized protein LOC126902774 isoform X2 n=1 Tax=Daktulosphaira vitifoliae TaxID=58002 RepID=UPI0021AAB738|nr:uncharacterized protein LOC126902774 isoform X2 [Daktulosphaira vitifoliae]
MKLFFLIFCSNIIFMVIHNDHNMSMSKALDIKLQCTRCIKLRPVAKLFDNGFEYCTDCRNYLRIINDNMCPVIDYGSNFLEDYNIPTIKPIKPCVNCKNVNPVAKFYDNCIHEYCKDCRMDIRINRKIHCIMNDCKGIFPIGMHLYKCDNCKEVVTKIHRYEVIPRDIKIKFCENCEQKYSRNEFEESHIMALGKAITEANGDTWKAYSEGSSEEWSSFKPYLYKL